ncbi:hypothetical protein TRIUR3_11688 [Triticum urartu]|uniref:Non-haem dioxygenase N-terminal domain-containing protein n=1 Tax=Triticum urartu TaxID=4572 RepID=M8A1E8_TRIUA|nr:hypothetical protein TRIUR3_11688 [Triticum urartu]
MPTPSHRHCPNHPKGDHGDCAGACGGDGIPVIDLGVLLNGNAEERSQATHELGQACEHWGFFMIVSNGRYKAVLHRALVHGGQMRMSFVSLVGPCLDAVVEPVLELAQNDPQGMKFRGIRYRDYMEHQQSSKMNTKAALDIVRVQDFNK